MLRERLSIVTQAWFAQREFTDMDILRRFQESLAEEKVRGSLEEGDKDQYLGMSLRELIHEFKWQSLVLFKCALLQPKVRSIHLIQENIGTVELMFADALFRFPLRSTLHGPIRAHIPHPGSPSQPTGLCRPRTQQLREDLVEADELAE